MLLPCFTDPYQVPAAAETEFAAAVKKYTKDVEAHIRNLGKAGKLVARAPRTQEEWAPVYAQLLKELVETQQQRLDIMRWQAGLPALNSRVARQRAAPTWAVELEEDEEEEEEEEEEKADGSDDSEE
jgi:hypothetical protein